MSQPNWAKLFSEGRCKDIGVSWSEEELHALYTLGIPVDAVRDGILTREDLSSWRGEEMDADSIIKKAIEINPNATTAMPLSVAKNIIAKNDGKEVKATVSTKNVKSSKKTNS